VANHSSAKKRIRQNETRRVRNKSGISNLKTDLKKFESTLVSDKEQAKTAFSKIQSALFKAVSKGFIRKGTASRKVSRFAAKIK
jgi:small subunit ribosomal protein S20